MVTKWVVDSNCFIHLGSMADNQFKAQLNSILVKLGESLYVTDGVFDECRTVRFNRWKKKPLVMEELRPLLKSTKIDENQIRGLGQAIGEKAAPQDVDLSLMVLASNMAREGHDVTLVSDDFKMTRTSKEANLGFKTIPPSTFVNDLSDLANGDSIKKLNSLSRRVRAAEMKYAISRRTEYDIQSKLTWMIDSLLADRSPVTIEVEDSAPSNKKMVKLLRKHLRGGELKPAQLEKLGKLPNICAPISKIDEFIESRGNYKSGTQLFSQVLQETGMGLAPLDSEEAEIAHRAMSPALIRMETALGFLAQIDGEIEDARMHLSRALLHATLIDDQGAEIQSLQKLGLLAIACGDASEAANFFEVAEGQAFSIKKPYLIHLVAACIANYISGEIETAEAQIEQAHDVIEADEKSASIILEELGESFMALSMPGIAIEVLDEAMECAMQSDRQDIEQLSELLVQANEQITQDENHLIEGLRGFLDKLNSMDE